MFHLLEIRLACPSLGSWGRTAPRPLLRQSFAFSFLESLDQAKSMLRKRPRLSSCAGTVPSALLPCRTQPPWQLCSFCSFSDKAPRSTKKRDQRINQRSKASRAPPGHWQDRSNVMEALKKAQQTLGIEKVS